MFAYRTSKTVVEKKPLIQKKQCCKYKAMNYLKGIAGLNQDLRVDTDSLGFHYLVKHNNKVIFHFTRSGYNSKRNNIS